MEHQTLGWWVIHPSDPMNQRIILKIVGFQHGMVSTQLIDQTISNWLTFMITLKVLGEVWVYNLLGLPITMESKRLVWEAIYIKAVLFVFKTAILKSKACSILTSYYAPSYEHYNS